MGAEGGEILISFKDHDLVGGFGSGEDTVGQGAGFVVANPIAVIAGGGTWSVVCFKDGMPGAGERERQKEDSPNDLDQLVLIIGAILCDKLCQDGDGGLGGLGGTSGDEAGGRVPSGLIFVL